ERAIKLVWRVGALRLFCLLCQLVDAGGKGSFPRVLENARAIGPRSERNHVVEGEPDECRGEEIARHQAFETAAPVLDVVAVPVGEFLLSAGKMCFRDSGGARRRR